MKRLSINHSKEEIYEAYKKALDRARVEKYRNSKHIEHKKEIRAEKNKAISTISYKNFKMRQVLWGVNKRLDKLRGRYKSHQLKGRKEGYNIAVRRMDRTYFKSDNPARFIGHVNLLSDVMNLKTDECAFLLWANRYDYFTKSDFLRDMEDTGVPYYGCLVRLRRKEYIMKLEEAKEFGRFKFALTGTGKVTAVKIDKFVKKVT
jgi:hypothetical protein